jgi:hypothetical protein
MTCRRRPAWRGGKGVPGCSAQAAPRNPASRGDATAAMAANTPRGSWTRERARIEIPI